MVRRFRLGIIQHPFQIFDLIFFFWLIKDQLYHKRVKPPFIPDKTILISDEEIIQMNEDSIPVLEKIKTDYSESNRSKERTRSAVKKDVDSRDSRDFRDNDDDDDDDNDKDKDEDESEPWDKYF